MSGAVHKSSLLLVKSLWSIELKKVTTKEFLRLKVNQCFHDKATTASEKGCFSSELQLGMKGRHMQTMK